MPPTDSSAVVLGASMAGLLAARALSTHFHHVTVVDRDVLPAGEDLRKGVPQAAHAHGLLASGYRVLDAYFPKLMDELEGRGAQRGDVVGDFLWFQYGYWKLRHESGLRGITVSRPCLESAVRRHVKELPNVRFLEGVDGTGPAFDTSGERVTGLTVRDRENGYERTLECDLLVDASGRGSQSPKWLESAGFGRPRQDTVRVDVGYATRVFERRPGDFFDSIGGIVAGAPPKSRRLAAVLAAEDSRWVITLVGLLGDHPPTDESGWLRFAGTLPSTAVRALASSARPLTEIRTYKFPANRRLRYEQMRRFPSGYIVIGDAVCSFNPIFGQGMSVAATEASALDETLAGGLEHLARRFYARAKKIIDIPWAIATGEDLRYPEVEGKRPPGSAVLNRYLERVHASASADPFVCRRFFDVLNLLAPPPSLLSPQVAWRVLSRRLPGGQGSPWGDLTPSE